MVTPPPTSQYRETTTSHDSPPTLAKPYLANLSNTKKEKNPNTTPNTQAVNLSFDVIFINNVNEAEIAIVVIG